MMNNTNDIEFEFLEGRVDQRTQEPIGMEAYLQSSQAAHRQGVTTMEWRSEDFPDCLRDAGLDNFSRLWQADIPWVEEPNFRRRGWSGVVVLTLKGETFYIKRQNQHCFHSLRYLLGKPTLWREWRNILHGRALGLPVPDVLYYGETRGKQAILVTRAIGADYTPFIDYLHQEHSPQERRLVLQALAAVLKTMAEHGLRHGCCYAKHFFICIGPEEGGQVRMIDLEKMRQWRRRKRAQYANLNQLLGHLPELSQAERDYFLQLSIPDQAERGLLEAEIKRRLAKHIARTAELLRRRDAAAPQSKS